MPGYTPKEVLSAGINFGKPDNEFIVEANLLGEATSCRNVRTGIEYIGGGGGDSDFSVAEVTINYYEGDENIAQQVYLPIIDEENGCSKVQAANAGDVFSVVLYKGKTSFNLLGEIIANPQGDIAIDELTGDYIITGDCSFELSPFL